VERKGKRDQVIVQGVDKKTPKMVLVGDKRIGSTVAEIVD